MKTLQHDLRPGGFASRLRQAHGFTLMEVSFVFGIATLLIGGFLGFMVTSARLTRAVTTQCTLNQRAGNGVELLRNRIRLADTLQVDANGENLTMTFDDDPSTDSDGDGIPYNDQDHTEVFTFRYGTGNSPTSGVNFIDWVVGAKAPRTVFQNVRKLPSGAVFSMTNDTATAVFRFGLIDPYPKDGLQNIEIITQATRRNHQ